MTVDSLKRFFDSFHRSVGTIRTAQQLVVHFFVDGWTRHNVYKEMHNELLCISL
jgi:hypothetical protein